MAVLSATGSANAARTWTTTAYPGQGAVYETAVGQPINADGTSNFKSNGKGVIPIKFDLKAGLGDFRFESVLSDASLANDYAFVSFRPPAPLALADLTELSAQYSFTEGDCGGGSLRWSVRLDADGDGNDQGPSDGEVFVYYGDSPNWVGCNEGSSQSGANLRQASDLRVDTGQVGGTFYDSWAGLAQDHPDALVTRASLVLDSGWFAGDQRVTLTSATVNDTTFTPAAGTALARTCDLPAATIEVTKTSGANAGGINEPVTVQPGDDNGKFRVVDCRYMYNLAVSSLAGPGTYQVRAIVDGVPAGGAATFQLR